MALDGTLDGLKASIADFLNRSDLTGSIPDFITIAEAQMARRFVSRYRNGQPIPRRLVLRADASFADGDEYTAVPDDIMGPLVLTLTDSDSQTIELDYLDPTRLQDVKTRGYWPGYTFVQPPNGAPKFYTIVGGEIQILPVADKAYTAELTYVQRFPALTSTATSNWILTDYPDAYLYGALTASAPYLRDDGRVTVWGTLFTTALDDICNADPMPSDKTQLRTEISLVQRFSRGGGGRYDINTDTP